MNTSTRLATIAAASLLVIACSPRGSSTGTITSKDTYAPSLGGSNLASLRDPYLPDLPPVNLRTGFHSIDIPLWSDSVGMISVTLMLSRDEADTTNYGLPMGAGWQIWLDYPDHVITNGDGSLTLGTPHGSTTYVPNGTGVWLATPNDNTKITYVAPTGAAPYYLLTDYSSNVEATYSISKGIGNLTSIFHLWSTNRVDIQRDPTTLLIASVAMSPTGHAATVNYTSSAVSVTRTFQTNGPSMTATAAMSGANLTVTSPGQTAGSTLVDSYSLTGPEGRVTSARMAGTESEMSFTLDGDGKVTNINVEDMVTGTPTTLATFCRNASTATTRVLLPLGTKEVFTFASVNNSNDAYLASHQRPDSTIDQYYFDSYGRVTQHIYEDSAGNAMTNLNYAYDPNCNIITNVTDNLASPARSLFNVASFDSNGNCFPAQMIIDQYGSCVRQKHDIKGRLVSSKYGSDCTDATVVSSVTTNYTENSDDSYNVTYYHNGVAQLIESYFTDWSLQMWQFADGSRSHRIAQVAFDLLPTKIQDTFTPPGASSPTTTVTTIGYDATRAVASYSDPTTPLTTISRNNRGWLTGTSNPLIATTVTYNDDGTPATATIASSANASGSSAVFGHDDYSRLTRVILNGNTVTSLTPGLPSAPTTCQ